MDKETNPAAESSDPAPVPHADCFARALERLRTAALAVDRGVSEGRRASRAARIALARGLRDALRYVRRGAALAEIAVDGSVPETGAIFLIEELDRAAVHFARAARDALKRLRAKGQPP